MRIANGMDIPMHIAVASGMAKLDWISQLDRQGSLEKRRETTCQEGMLRIDVCG